MMKFSFFVSHPSFFRKSFQISLKRPFSSAQASFYDLLEVDRKSSLLDIKSAYYKKGHLFMKISIIQRLISSENLSSRPQQRPKGRGSLNELKIGVLKQF